jgi:septal ring factor EnvC (AmiA/AmiB activator)
MNRAQYYLILAGILILIPVAGIVRADDRQKDIVNQKNELEKIEKEMAGCQKNLDSLKQAEKKIQKEIADYEQRASISETVLRRLNKQLESIRGNIEKSRRNLVDSKNRLNSSRSRFIGNLKYYYSGTRSKAFEKEGEIKKEKDALRRLLYLKALASYDRAELTRSAEYLREAEKDYTGLVDEEKTVGTVQKKKKSEYTIVSSQMEKREKELSRLKRKKQGEADRLASLSEAAREMEDLIARLETARQERESEKEEFKFETGRFAALKGGLPAPMPGRVITGFGWKVDPVTKLKSFTPGIQIAGKKNSNVIAVADGTVAYIGNIRGYGNFIIIEHEDGYYTTYAGLDNLNVEQGEIVGRGKTLGLSKAGNMKFELRQGKESLDPIEWIKIDYFK